MGFEEQGATPNRVEIVANQRLETPQRTSYRTNYEQKGYKGGKAKITRLRAPKWGRRRPHGGSLRGEIGVGWAPSSGRPPPARQPS
jgi:hypothetical protein